MALAGSGWSRLGVGLFESLEETYVSSSAVMHRPTLKIEIYLPMGRAMRENFDVLYTLGDSGLEAWMCLGTVHLLVRTEN